jgi:hypothetical protein
MAANFADWAEIESNITNLKTAEASRDIAASAVANGPSEYDFSGAVEYFYRTEAAKYRADLGLSDDYTQEDLDALKNKQMIEYEERQKSAYLSYLTDSYSEKVRDTAAGLVANTSTMLIDREKIKSDLGVTDDWT